MNKLILKSVKGKIVIENNDKKTVKKNIVDKPSDDNNEIEKLLKEIEKMNNTQNNDYPNITNPNYIKRLNYLINLGVNLKEYEKDFIYYFVNKSWNNNSKEIDKDDVLRLMMELKKKGFKQYQYGINSRLSHLFKLYIKNQLDDENIKLWTKKQIRVNKKALTPQEKTNEIIRHTHLNHITKAKSMLNSLKIDITKDDFNEIKDYIDNFKSK
jgi:hypothetical protein